MPDKDKRANDASQNNVRIVPLGRVEKLTGHDSHGNNSDGGGTSSKYKDPGRGAGE